MAPAFAVGGRGVGDCWLGIVPYSDRDLAARQSRPLLRRDAVLSRSGADFWELQCLGLGLLANRLRPAHPAPGLYRRLEVGPLWRLVRLPGARHCGGPRADDRAAWHQHRAHGRLLALAPRTMALARAAGDAVRGCRRDISRTVG